MHAAKAHYLAIHKLTSTYKNTEEYKYVISGFRREVHEMCALLGHYAAHSGNTLPTFRGKLPVPSSSFEKCKKETSRNVGEDLALYAA
jgi:hypothetical protein